MTFSRSKITLVSVLLFCAIASATDYYMQDFFPIGFTGFNFTHHWTWATGEGTPYPQGYDYGEWADERELLESTGCNFIGCSDADEIDLTNIFV